MLTCPARSRTQSALFANGARDGPIAAPAEVPARAGDILFPSVSCFGARSAARASGRGGAAPRAQSGRSRRASIRAPCRRRPAPTSSPTSFPKATSLIAAWEARFGPYDAHAASAPDAERLAAAWDAFGERMADHYPFFHPRYAGQMLKPPHPVAVAGYLAAMLVNPNNHALDGGPGASGLEVEVVEQLRSCSGSPPPASAT